MRPFDLKAALAGAPVVTKQGDPVIELHYFDKAVGVRKLYGVISTHVTICGWTDDGTSDWSSEFNLFMAPAKHEGWINIYRTPEVDADASVSSVSDPPFHTTYPFRTKQIADEHASKFPGRIACIRIEWED
jgi:hypothetical protein